MGAGIILALILIIFGLVVYIFYPDTFDNVSPLFDKP